MSVGQGALACALLQRWFDCNVIPYILGDVLHCSLLLLSVPSGCQVAIFGFTLKLSTGVIQAHVLGLALNLLWL